MLKKIFLRSAVFGPKWEGSYVIGDELGDGDILLRAWNNEHLPHNYTRSLDV